MLSDDVLGRDDRGRGSARAAGTEHLLLDGEVLGHDFDDERGPGSRSGDILGGAHPSDPLRLVSANESGVRVRSHPCDQPR
jgi:hypothetical protein